MTFAPGATITVREVLQGQTWAEWAETVVRDDGEALATFQRDGTSLAFPEHPRPHPWGHLQAWRGTSVLKLRRARDWYSVWLFFTHGEFDNWYVNFEQPVVRRADGIDINDLQLDLVVDPDGSWRWKDVEDLAPALASARMDLEQLGAVLAAAAEVVDLLERDDRWWAPWDDWQPSGCATMEP